MKFNIRRAEINDLEFFVQIDLKSDGYTVSDEVIMTKQEKKEHREKIKSFVTEQDKGAFIAEDLNSNKRIALVMYSIVNRDSVYPWKTIYNELDCNLFQNDGRFMEIFQLWVHPYYRRRGLATKCCWTLRYLAQAMLQSMGSTRLSINCYISICWRERYARVKTSTFFVVNNVTSRDLAINAIRSRSSQLRR